MSKLHPSIRLISWSQQLWQWAHRLCGIHHSWTTTWWGCWLPWYRCHIVISSWLCTPLSQACKLTKFDFFLPILLLACALTFFGIGETNMSDNCIRHYVMPSSTQEPHGLHSIIPNGMLHLQFKYHLGRYWCRWHVSPLTLVSDLHWVSPP